MDNVLQIDKQILNSDKIICRHINNLCNSTRGEISQDILSQLRHFVEHILLKIYASIFYTAITRAREKLKIYWTQSVEKKVLDRIKPKNNHQDISLLKQELLLRK